jgi:hypothetical protein
MKVYVCYRYVEYEGSSTPEAAFLSEERAKQWVADMDMSKPDWYDGQRFDYEELEVGDWELFKVFGIAAKIE